MKVTFEGTPENVLAEMKLMIAGMSSPIATPASSSSSEPARAPSPLEPEPKVERNGITYTGAAIASAPPARDEGAPGESTSQRSNDVVCIYCESYTGSIGWVRKHEKHCKKNANRIPHPKEGKPTPWLRKKNESTSVSSESASINQGETNAEVSSEVEQGPLLAEATEGVPVHVDEP